MFEFDAAKLVIIGIVALVVIGPKELPRVMRQVGQAIAKIRRLGAEFQAQFMDAIREADLEEIKLEAAKISEAAKLDAGMDPLAGIRAELTKTMEETPEGTSAASAATSSEAHSEPLCRGLARQSRGARSRSSSGAGRLPLASLLPLVRAPYPRRKSRRPSPGWSPECRRVNADAGSDLILTVLRR